MSERSDVIDISGGEGEIDPSLVESRLEEILNVLGIDEDVEFSVTFVDDDAIRELNKKYRDKDEATDILSFVQSDGLDAWPDDTEQEQARVLGDMVISLSAMRRNSKDFGVSEDEELHRLLVHGVLHLLGYDHKSNDVEKEPMLQKQEELLKRLRER